MNDIQTTRRNLPHWHKEDAIYWITFRLADSIPAHKQTTWTQQRNHWLSLHPKPWSEALWKEYHLRFGRRFEKWLDAGYGTCALRKTDLRKKVVGVLMRFHGERHLLHQGVIMPNHVHLLLEPFLKENLSLILRGMKGTSSRACNQTLGRSGKFWMAESYDHIVRSQAQ